MKRGRLNLSGRSPHRSGDMNRLEKNYYEEVLKPKLLAGEYTWVAFEPFKLRLADNTFYTPDFVAISKDGQLEVHEVKGFWEDDARVKWKIAAEQFYFFRFFAITVKNKLWSIEEYGE